MPGLPFIKGITREAEVPTRLRNVPGASRWLHAATSVARLRLGSVRSWSWPSTPRSRREPECHLSSAPSQVLPNPTGFLRLHRPASGTFERLAELFEVLHGAVYPPPSRCAWVGRH